MRDDQELAERKHEVRLAAFAWHRAGKLDGKALETIHVLYPDDRVRVGPAFRVLLFLFAIVAVNSAVTLFALFEVPTGLLLVLAACASVATNEAQMGKYRRAGTGSEEATALMAVIFTVAAYGWLVSESGADEGFWRSIFFVAAAVSAVGAWRWGVAVLGAASAASAFFMLSWWPGARVAWILLALVLVVPLLRGSISQKLAPSHRRACDVALVSTLLALYVALHLGSFDVGLLETELLSGFSREASSSALRWFFVLSTVVMPAALLFTGIWLRRPILLRSGIAFAVASLVTLRFYVHVAPLWVVLTASGGAAVALAMLVHRWLASGPGKERYGFTPEPVFERLSPAAVLEVGMAATLAAAPAERVDEPAFRGGGGEFGGGGASGTY